MPAATYPVISVKPHSIELEIEGEKTVISYDLSKKVLTVIHGQKTLLEAVKKDALKKHSIDIAGHAVEIFYKKQPIDLYFVPDEGLSVKVDGKPVEGSIADPIHQLNIASFALYTLSVFFFLALLYPILSGEAVAPTTLFIALLIGSLLVILGYGIKKMPRLCIAIGTLIGTLSFIGSVIPVFAGQATNIFSLILTGGPMLVLWKSLMFTLRGKHLS